MKERDPEGQITSEVRGHIFLMGLDRPEKLNGLTPKMFMSLRVRVMTSTRRDTKQLCALGLSRRERLLRSRSPSARG